MVGLVLAVTGCVSPDRSDYEFAARQHATWAQQARQQADEQREAAKSLAQRGDQSGASDAENAARAADRNATTEQVQADKDHFLSLWWPVLPRRHDYSEAQ
jgi:hypothetical protein